MTKFIIITVDVLPVEKKNPKNNESESITVFILGWKFYIEMSFTSEHIFKKFEFTWQAFVKHASEESKPSKEQIKK